MPRSGYSDVNWFLRSVRVLPVIAGAALLGGMIGGFAIFAIDSALTWDPVSHARPEARADNQAGAADPQTTKPVRIVGGAIPDPSAGMSFPPPAQPQQHNASAQSQAKVSSELPPQLLTPKPLGPASQLHSQAATADTAQAPNAPQVANQQNQTANQTQLHTPAQAPVQAPVQASAQAPVQTRNATAPAQQPTHWPDALSRAHRSAANAQQQTAPAAAAPASEPTATNKDEKDRKEASTDRASNAASADGQDRFSSRRSRHSTRHPVIGTDGSRNGSQDDASAAPSRPQDARNYNRLYDSNGSRKQQSYGNAGDAKQDQSYGSRRQRSYSSNAREQSYGDAREDQDNGGYRFDPPRSDARRNGRDAGYRGRSRVIVREQPEEADRAQAFDAPRPRSEPFWGGGFFRRGAGYRDDD